MKAPQRLSADPSVAPGLRTALGRMREASFDTDNALRRFSATVAAGTVVAGSTVATKASAGGVLTKQLTLSTLVKLSAGMVLALGVTTAVIHARPAEVTNEAPKTKFAETSVASPMLAPPTASASAEIPTVDVLALPTAPVAVRAAAPTAPSRAAATPEAPEATGATGPEVGTEDVLLRETEQLARIRRMLDAEPTRALELAEAGNVEFRNGVFGEERESIVVGALARLGRADEASARAKRFVAAHPRSAFVPRVKRDGRID